MLCGGRAAVRKFCRLVVSAVACVLCVLCVSVCGLGYLMALFVGLVCSFAIIASMRQNISSIMMIRSEPGEANEKGNQKEENNFIFSSLEGLECLLALRRLLIDLDHVEADGLGERSTQQKQNAMRHSAQKHKRQQKPTQHSYHQIIIRKRIPR